MKDTLNEDWELRLIRSAREELSRSAERHVRNDGLLLMLVDRVLRDREARRATVALAA
jgi:hypothetical protein